MSTYEIISTILVTVFGSSTVIFKLKQLKERRTARNQKSYIEKNIEAYGDISHHAGHSQQICNSTQQLIKRIKNDDTYDAGKILAELSPIFDSMASLNGQIQEIYKKNSKQ